MDERLEEGFWERKEYKYSKMREMKECEVEIKEKKV